MLNSSTPHFAFFGTQPAYDHLCVFGCMCYSNLSTTTPHKLAPRSAMCVFLGFSTQHKGYHCLDLASNKVIISTSFFDENAFTFVEQQPSSTSRADLEFLDSTDFVSAPIRPSQPLVPAGLPLGSAGWSPLHVERCPTPLGAAQPREPIV